MPAADLRSDETKYNDYRVEKAVTAERERWIEIIADWANDEGVSFDATTRLSHKLGLK